MSRVHYPGLESHPQHQLAKRQQRGGGAVVSFEVKGGRAAAWRVIDSTRLMSLTANLGDVKTTIIHPASTTHGRIIAGSARGRRHYRWPDPRRGRPGGGIGPERGPAARTGSGAARFLLVAVAYFGAAKLSLLVAIPPGYATAIWPPSGIAVAALLLGGGRLWPAVWAGSFAANITIDWAYAASTIIATGSTLQTLAIAGLVREHIGVLHRFETVAHVVRFVLIAALGCAIAPTFALLPLGAFYEMSAVELAGNWATWWQGDACGVLTFAPLILGWLVPRTTAWTPGKLLEAGVFAVVLLAASQLVLSAGFERAFLIVPFIVWAAFRFGSGR